MQYDHVLNNMNFDLFTLRSGGRVCGQYNCYHVAIFRDPLLFDMQHDIVLKKLNFDLLTLRSGGGSEGKIIATMWLYIFYFMIPFNLILILLKRTPFIRSQVKA